MAAQEVELTHDLPHRVLTKALEEKMGMRAGDAHEIAGYVLEAFGGEQELHDDEISPELRSVFYELEEERLLSFRREEYHNEDGNLRRAFYWRIRWDEVADQDAGTQTPETGSSVYDELPGKAWKQPEPV